MVKSDKTATMDDVAKAAGVSIGTVDRVVHNREGVSEKTRKRVFKVIKEIGYQPNIYASILSQKKTFCIVAVIPYFQSGEYWELVYDGVTRAVQQAQPLHVELKVFYYNQFDMGSFMAACRNTLDANPSGVLIAPIYKDETTRLVKQLSALSIPFIYIDTKPENTDYLAYFGMPMFESGYLAADLLVGRKPVKKVVSFSINRGGAPQNDSMRNRHRGFLAYLNEHNPDCHLIDVTMSPTDFLYNVQVFDTFFEENSDVNHIVTFNSRAHLISDWMEIKGITGKELIGFDVLPSNVRALKKGKITTLIAERTTNSAYEATQALIDYLVLRKKPAKRDSYSSIDILTQYNIDYYSVDC